jgi:CRISPR-associated endoribonuclease Cas6
MPFSLVLQGYPQADVPVAHVQGPALQGMFLHLIQEVDPAVNVRLHNDDKYRPYTLSPLGIVADQRDFQGYWLPRQHLLNARTPCYVRITLLDDALFPTFSSYFLSRLNPTFHLGDTEFTVTNVLTGVGQKHPWAVYRTYAELLARAAQHERRITLQFLTPTSFRVGDIDLPMPLPRLVFRSYQKRFTEFCQEVFLPDFETLVETYVGVASLQHIHTQILKTKNVSLIGFTGTASFEIHRNAPPEFVQQMNWLADYAFFCGTGRKTTVGMGQTMRSYYNKQK